MPKILEMPWTLSDRNTKLVLVVNQAPWYKEICQMV